ncbi:hypothetical protein CE557_554 [Cardinium endosymbiont of Sogatella furcifera]|uniref:DUF1609 domain-containing protein n=1 Tax=Cardinium endosymbiont of Sogatella furcifera TaxID=650378 RepID=UPI000E0DBCA4|nr:DUF1609 domain-containing protein [Cardinium endosymbiont of Sogatella furcifera]AXI24362.1 hypothetical protein CE557_554 [Cardinium endosymbiont of Sogatella furcifera]
MIIILLYLGTLFIAPILSCNNLRSSYQMTVKLYSDIVSTRVTDTKSIATVPDITPTNLSQEKEKPTKEEETTSYRFLRRVKRWLNNKIELHTIRGFSDNGTLTYAHLLDEQVWTQHAFHYMPGVVDLLNGQYHDQYFIKTPQGRCARASLVLLPKQKNKPKEVYRDGTIAIGIDTSNPKPTIYHMMFHPKENRPSLKIPYMPLIKQNKFCQKHAKKVEQVQTNDQGGLHTEKVKKIITYFNKKENAYIVKYTPPEQSSYKLITIYIHMIETDNPSEGCMEN